MLPLLIPSFVNNVDVGEMPVCPSPQYQEPLKNAENAGLDWIMCAYTRFLAQNLYAF